MKKILKLVSMLTILILVNDMFFPVLANSTMNQIAEAQTENVIFDANIAETHNATLDIQNGGNLNIKIKLNSAGYLKDAVLIFENNNYSIISSNSQYIKSINSNSIELNPINAGEDVEIQLPIKITKTNLIKPEMFDQDSSITLNGIYINKDNSEQKIAQTVTNHIKWVANSMSYVNQSLVRYIKYDANKTMIGFKVIDGITDDLIPIKNKMLSVITPKLNNNLPIKVIVTGENISYTYENEKLTITKNNIKNADGKIVWDSKDEYYITYIYDSQVDIGRIENTIESSITTIDNKIITNTTANSSFNITEQIGNIVETTILGTEQLNKGYMYTNTINQTNKLETAYNLQYNINIGYSDLLDEIHLSENNINHYTIAKKVTVSSVELEKILGGGGIIKVFTQDGVELGTLNKDDTSLEIKNSENIKIVTSKPITEGNIIINVERAIRSDLSLSKVDIANLKSIDNNISITGKLKGNTVSYNETSKTITLNEPTSKASLDISTNNLTTIGTNKDVVITTTLETNDITDALYSNPIIEITLPKEVKNINMTDAKLIYEDELLPTQFYTENNVIKLTLTGTQTKYSSQITASGTIIRIVSDLTLDNLATSTAENISLAITNGATGETNTIMKSANIVAPSNFITTNSITLNEITTTSQESDKKTVIVQAYSELKNANISGIAINNTGSDVTGFKLLGRIPSLGNTSTDGTNKNLNSTFDTQIKNALKITGADFYSVYYSNNPTATQDVSLASNLWTTSFDYTAKSYMIVISSSIINGTKISFNYDITIPENLKYEQMSTSSFSIYYDNNAQAGINQNVVAATDLLIKTPSIPKLVTAIKAFDDNTGNEITETDKLYPGQYVKYVIASKNTGSETAKEVSANVSWTAEGEHPVTQEMVKQSDCGFVSEEYDSAEDTYFRNIDKINNNKDVAFGDILVGEEKKIEVLIYISSNLYKDSKITIRAILTMQNSQETSNASFANIYGDGTLNLHLDSNRTAKKLQKDDTMKVTLSLVNYNSAEIKNVLVKIQFPSEIDFVSGDEAEYSAMKNEITYTISSISTYNTKNFEFYVKINKDVNETISFKAMATFDGISESISSNSIIYTIGNSKILTATMSSSIPEGNILDTDQLNYYIKLENTLDMSIRVDIRDYIPKQLKTTGYTVINGSNTFSKAVSDMTISLGEDVKQGETIQIIINTIPYRLGTASDSVNIENVPKIYADNQEIAINTLKHTIRGTSNFTTKNADETQDKINNYSIKGQVWNDKNQDGIKDDNEEKISGIELTLYSKEKKEIVKDSNGIEIKATSDDNGIYELNNVPVGEYIVVAKYDNIKYAITKFQRDGTDTNKNSDFIEATLYGVKVAATNNIIISNSNFYNIDLGLNDAKRFDLEIEKSILKVVVSNPNKTTTSVQYDHKKLVKTELVGKTINNDTILVQYNLKITNSGNVSGYAKSIVDYIPNGMTFNSELNNEWYSGNDGNIYNNSLANAIILPGETKEINIIFTKKMNGNNVGMVHNVCEIYQEYSESGLNDIDSTPGNKKDGEDDLSTADIYIGIKTGTRNIVITGISLSIIGLIGLSIYEIKRKIIKK